MNEAQRNSLLAQAMAGLDPVDMVTDPLNYASIPSPALDVQDETDRDPNAHGPHGVDRA